LLSKAILTLIALAGACHAGNLLTNGSFEAVDASASPYFIRSFSSTPGWTQYGDGVDLVHNSYTQGPAVLVDASDGVQFLDMNQAGLIGGIYQIVNVDAGTAYHLSLDSAAWATNGIGGTLGYELYDPISTTVLASGSFTDNVGGTWNSRTLDAAAINSTLGVRIYGISAPAAGMGLDNVQLSVADTAAPEPGSFVLGALAGAAVLQSKRRRA
jgi:hypothetical protein